MLTYAMKRHLPWLSALTLGLCLIALGAYFLARGYSARADIRQELRDEIGRAHV